ALHEHRHPAPRRARGQWIFIRRPGAGPLRLPSWHGAAEAGRPLPKWPHRPGRLAQTPNAAEGDAMTLTTTPYRRGLSIDSFPVLALLNPGRLAPVAAASLAAGLAAGWSAYHFFGFPFWSITMIVLLALLPVGVAKWREDRRRYG